MTDEAPMEPQSEPPRYSRFWLFAPFVLLVLVAAGWTNVIIGTAGTEQKGPHMVDGEHKFVMEWSADKIARSMGKTKDAIPHWEAFLKLGPADSPYRGEAKKALAELGKPWDGP